MTFGGNLLFPPFHLYKIFIQSILLFSCANIALSRTFFGLFFFNNNNNLFTDLDYIKGLSRK